MNKSVLFILSILLGMAYEWSSIFLYSYLLYDLDPALSFIVLPIILCFITARYFISKKMGYSPVFGLITGVVVGFIWLSIAMAGA